ncbi:hypothetical protein T02_11857 [Trichinella nativa]|uniref:Uncharacterized protein n=1 Tax=Trichinella nativa TaxID=6335 RepID=A0A0V1LNW9_9BILA|nr:hypothetical protein T02_11857 [Trichinella nativa]
MNNTRAPLTRYWWFPLVNRGAADFCSIYRARKWAASSSRSSWMRRRVGKGRSRERLIRTVVEAFGLPLGNHGSRWGSYTSTVQSWHIVVAESVTLKMLAKEIAVDRVLVP